MNTTNHDGSHSQPPQQQRRPRGFAAAAISNTTVTTPTTTTNPRTTRKEREKEKERTKLRERHRRAITSRMLAGLRQYGNFPLPARADMNDVLAALARDAGWTVEADGTTFRQSQPSSKLVRSFFHLSIHVHLIVLRFRVFSIEHTGSLD
ncbi:putative beta-amylase transcription factor BES/BZR family [Helianthus annuus]|nr:putative beta-amylase transcription factor BES/BZR family [Helianthus annuus]KAJ0634913.1 putative beta-amylase transcription factor BES/BZR family [Helianthus annuus]